MPKLCLENTKVPLPLKIIYALGPSIVILIILIATFTSVKFPLIAKVAFGIYVWAYLYSVTLMHDSGETLTVQLSLGDDNEKR